MAAHSKGGCEHHNPFLWRAGLPALGCEAALNRVAVFLAETMELGFFGAAAQPNAGKPARHSKPVGHNRPVA
ncbi:hypothetical protein CXQ82_12890 [Pseudomonas sp. S09G 359]|nr:hypothetical protein CXQ82_12890 [Pseudomonas sp. S09G 359]